MKYVSIDIETTGLNAETDQILSVGIVIEDTNNILPIEELPQLHIAINRERIEGGIYAINLNKILIENILNYRLLKTKEEREEYEKETKTFYLKENEVSYKIFEFFWENGIRFKEWENWGGQINGVLFPSVIDNTKIKSVHINVAGKNFGTFDKLFLEKIPQWKDFFFVRSRILDPAILCVDWVNDESLPSLNDCKERMDIEGVVTHNAVEDAIDVINVLRKNYVK